MPFVLSYRSTNGSRGRRLECVRAELSSMKHTQVRGLERLAFDTSGRAEGLQEKSLLAMIQRLARRSGDRSRELRGLRRRKLLAQQREHAAAFGEFCPRILAFCAGNQQDEFAALLIRVRCDACGNLTERRGDHGFVELRQLAREHGFPCRTECRDCVVDRLNDAM